MRTRRALIALSVAVCLLGVARPAGSTDPIAAAKQRAEGARSKAEAAERDYDRLSRESRDVAKQLASSFTQLDAITDKITAGQQRFDAAQAEERRLSRVVRDRAVQLYVKGSAPSVVQGTAADFDELRRMRLVAVVNGRDDNAIARWAEAREVVEEERGRLEARRREVEASSKALRNRDSIIQAKLGEAQRARDAARTAREQQVQALKDAESAAKAANRGADARQFASQRASVSNRPGGNVGAGVVVNGIRCPIAGSVSFSNDWGEPRSGGRTHKGTDLFSPNGTPNVAVIGGSVFRQSESVGGLSVYLQGDNGNTYYYTHLSGFAGPATGRVNQGDVLGYTGNTGNASGGVTHTHFEIRLGGPNGERVNPYPSLAPIC
ncbi:MAG: murein hydrolase activator EnvC family protein [Acidimicrobiia bacterium]